MRKIFTTIFTLSITSIIFCQESLDNNLQLGLYNTFYDFMVTNPIGRESFYLDSAITEKGEWSNYYFKTPRYYDNNNKVRNIWGFTDGNNSYVFYDNEFFKVFKDRDNLCFIGFGIPKTMTSGAVSAGVGVVGGVLGGAVGGAAAGAIYGAVADANARKKQHKYFIDENTGRIFTSIEALRDYRAKNVMSELIIYRMSKKEKRDSVFFKINNESYYFIPNSYLHLELPFTYKPIEVEYLDRLGNSVKTSFSLEEKEPVYVMCEYNSDSEQVHFIQVESQTGIFDSHKPQKVQKKRDKIQGKTENAICELIIYRMSKKEKTESVFFKINDKRYHFMPNSYLHLEIPRSCKSVEIVSLDTLGNSEKTSFSLEGNELVYVMCEYSSDLDKAHFVQVDAQTGKFDSHKPQKAQKERDKILTQIK